MNKLYFYKGHYGILDEGSDRIYWVNEDLSPEWSRHVHAQKSMPICDISAEFVCELGFNYEHVTDLSLNASLD